MKEAGIAVGNDTLKGIFKIPSMKRVYYGPDCVDSLGVEIDEHGAKKVFIVASNTLATKTDLVDRVQGILRGKAVGVFHHVSQHVHRESVLEATEQARRAGADFLVSVGGGSPIDCAKSMALCLAEGVTEIDQLDAYSLRFEYPDKIELPAQKHPEKTIKHISLSTTLSAGEFTDIAGMTDSQRKIKELFMYAPLMPVAAFLDPTLAVHTPAWLWAATGMRAVDHCVEAYVSQLHMPFVDTLAKEALTMLVRDLPASAENPEDVAGRGRCQVACWMSLFGLLNVQVGLSHGIGHQLGARCDVPHGVTSCIMLPHVMDFNMPVVKDRQAKLGEAFGIDPRGMSVDEGAQAFIAALRRFVEGLGVPTRLSEAGVTKEDFPGIVEDALHDLVVATNPRPVRKEDVFAILEKAY